MSIIKYLKDTFIGTNTFLAYQQDSQNQELTLKEISQILSKKSTPIYTGNIDEKPVFLFSAGWRSGSTLLQRLVLSANYFIWGEPLSESGVLQNLIKPLSTIRGNYPRDEYFFSESYSKDLSQKWIANITPKYQYTLKAMEAYIYEWLATPAKAKGCDNWGIKEVRWEADICYILKLLYPNAKFIFIVRDPLTAYSSYNKLGKHWYDEYPDKPVNTAVKYSKQWNKLSSSFKRVCPDVGGFLVRYEDLLMPKSLDKLDQYLEQPVDRGIIKNKVGSSHEKSQVGYIPKLDKLIISHLCKTQMKDFNYLD
ncbi:sulfotransferase family protein [Catenovulum adriaticum]|uniref:Sulfotransferase n=1 Tax=Catenovulum adriaticum TaxID=2984846 RepID=A0ABY7AMB2_9ALTE|nr:sulfotransferase [Catenovulum sp. TS8]WAJ70693.1 sulfotransferase [Catenovulum sp. TS8]